MGDVIKVSVRSGGARLEPALSVPADDGSRIAALARDLLALYPDADAVSVERAEGNVTAAS
jgi:hypothetical protein